MYLLEGSSTRQFIFCVVHCDLRVSLLPVHGRGPMVGYLLDDGSSTRQFILHAVHCGLCVSLLPVQIVRGRQTSHGSKRVIGELLEVVDARLREEALDRRDVCRAPVQVVHVILDSVHGATRGV